MFCQMTGVSDAVGEFVYPVVRNRTSKYSKKSMLLSNCVKELLFMQLFQIWELKQFFWKGLVALETRGPFRSGLCWVVNP